MEASWIASSKEGQVSDLCRKGDGFHFLGFLRGDTDRLSDKGPIYYWTIRRLFYGSCERKLRKIGMGTVFRGAFPSEQCSSTKTRRGSRYHL